MIFFKKMAIIKKLIFILLCGFFNIIAYAEQECKQDIHSDEYYRDVLSKKISHDDVSVWLGNIDRRQASQFDYYFLGYVHSIGLHVDKDLRKASSFYQQSMKMFLKYGAVIDDADSLFRSANFQLGLLSLLCHEKFTIKSALDYFSIAALGTFHDEALYYKSIIELYSIDGIAISNGKMALNPMKFSELYEAISKSSNHGFPLANFEFYYIAVFAQVSDKAIQKVKQRLLKTSFFSSCVYFDLQINYLMPYSAESEYRVKLIKQLDPVYYNTCRVQKGVGNE